MGLSSSSLYSESSPNKEQRTDKKRNSVYYLGELLSENQLQNIEGQVVQMTVCKVKTVGHWFIKLYLENNSEQALEMHYVDIGSVMAFYPDADSTQVKEVRETQYVPKSATLLKDILKKCLRIVTDKSYGVVSYSCQDFATEIMNKFTNRKVNPFFSKLKIPVLSQMSVPCGTKSTIMNIEKDFLQKCTNDGVSAGIEFLKIQNDRLDIIIAYRADDEIYLDVTKKFMYSVLQPVIDADLFESFLLLMRDQKQEVRQQINAHILKAWRLANFIILIDPERWKDTIDLMDPSDALNQYRYKLG